MALKEMVERLRQVVDCKKEVRRLGYEQRVLYLSLFAADPQCLKKARGQRSQREMAERTGLTQARVSALERGRLDEVSDEVMLRTLETYSKLEEGTPTG
jgi:transcriptional regulator with XRE-family HTH domain